MVPGDGDAATWVGGRSAPRAAPLPEERRVKPLRCPSDRARPTLLRCATTKLRGDATSRATQHVAIVAGPSASRRRRLFALALARERRAASDRGRRAGARGKTRARRRGGRARSIIHS
eukprot:31546-Pelagococcus_subviridis.AAC.5